MRKSPYILIILFALPSICVSQSLQLADSLHTKGEQLQESGNFKEAEFYYNEAYNIFRQHQDTAAWMKTGLYYAEVLYYRSKHDKALELFNLLKNTPHPVKDLSMKARIESDIGLLQQEAGNWEESVNHFNSAILLAKEASDSVMIGYSLLNLASLHKVKGDYTKSLEQYKETIPYFVGLDNNRGLVTAYNYIGGIYRDLHLYDRALDYYTRSLEIREKLQSVNLLATIYDNIGSLQKDLGNFDQALVAYQRSLEYREQAGSPERRASTLNNIGVLYSQMGNPERALEYYEESLEIKKSLSNRIQMATLYKNIATRQLDLGKVNEAANYLEQSLALRKQIGNPGDIASSLLDLARLEQGRDNPTVAMEYTQQAHAIADSLNDYDLLDSSSYRLGNLKKATGGPSAALPYYKQSLAYSRYLNKDSQISSLTTLARTYDALGSDSALVYGNEAIALIEQSRSRTGSDSGIKADFFEQYSGFYIDMASWSLTYNNNIAKAYYLVEQAKARSLSDELVQASQRIDEKLPEEVRIERNNMLNSINGLYSELQMVEDEDRRSDIESEIRKRELKYAAYQNELHNTYPEYKKLELQEPVTLYRAQEINEPETAVLEYAINRDRFLAFFISNKEFSVQQYSLEELKANREIDVKQLVQNFKDAILSHAGREELDFYSSRLYALLLEPFEEQLANHSKLIIVPDGALAYLPFEAIRTDNSYLVEQYEIKYIPSITSLTLLKEPGRDQQKQLLAVAGSEVMNINSETGARMSSLSALPSTLIEVDSIASHFSEVTMLKEEEVTESALKQHLNSNYKYIHLATHGYIDEDQPAQSGLRLSGMQGVEAYSENDGLLKSSEIYQLNLSSNMVVLSACNTGIGKVVRGEGMLGLQRSFFYAGTSSVVVSLWNVYDRSTAHLMNEFYKSMLSEEQSSGASWTKRLSKWVGWDESIPFGEKAAAMRSAKLSLMNHPLYNHPVYWAPFIVVGR